MRIIDYGNDYAFRDGLNKKENAQERKAGMSDGRSAEELPQAKETEQEEAKEEEEKTEADAGTGAGTETRTGKKAKAKKAKEA